MSNSSISRYVQKQQELERIKEELARLESDPKLQQEMEFKSRLEQLMGEFEKTAKDVIAILNPSPAEAKDTASTSTGRRKRKLKVYKHPETGEVVETRGGNHKTLKSWKDEFGADEVESWLVQTQE
ncbi:H-NS family protein MvaT [Modicisalibacter xianhensis]|uniref:H-NS family protein MvaT n=1 Tax=Modicisalibacter xianhensis TaxID=442341 RepID=A0A4R8FN96_9GAMM|nr:histone-like nucleoid-structuring protein, MvaT/MvaU family [Halomonas xianhensis]TDX23721.1 H-NS family protein MvaT [Halomonas xianhensis]